MELIFEDTHQLVWFDKSQSLMKLIIKPVAMTTKEAMECSLLYRAFLRKHKPEKVIRDSRQSTFEADEAFQLWTDENIHPTEKEIIKKCADIFSLKFINTFGLDEVDYSNLNLPYEVKIFSDEKEAIDWVMN